ncbi:hypothetical protein RJZ57_003448 [Blastomyces gilchristii]
MVPDVFPLPGVVHGNRVVATIIETRAKAGANTQPWVSVPIDDNDISAGYRDVSFQQLNNAANHAARWLSQALPATSEPFQYFAYAGPKDLRYPCLAVAAAKLQKVMVLPSPLLTLGAQLRVQEKTNCKLYLRPSEMAGPASNILRNAPHVEQITASGIEEFFRDDEADPMVYSKTWDEGKEDPWLVFHTSGTTVHGDGIHAALLEEEIVAHPSVKAAVIGGFGRPVPVLLVELVPAAEADDVDALKRSLEPYIEKANVHCHDVVKLSSERLIVAKKGKPFVTTLKGNALRLQTLELYEEEIPALFD